MPPVMREKIKGLILALLTVFIWLLLGMVYVERFPPPFTAVERLLMPWKETIPARVGLDQRLAIMQDQLNGAVRTSHYAFVVMILAFTAFSAYLSVLYQQKQRRAHENMLLVLKNQEIARRNEFIRYISATIGHEFKNNLGRIKRRIDLLAGIPADARERIDDNLDKLFADIAIFRRIADEREASLIEFMNVDLRVMLSDLAAHYKDLADLNVPKNIPVPVIYAAPPLLKTVFENVIDNAVKYKKPGDDRARVLILCSTDRDGSRRYVTISFRDEGIGMDEHQADLCFYKGKGSAESWGQGLYFAKYVVGLHAGKIRIGKEYTAPGRGTEIIMNLPFVVEQGDV